jgi:hypothetical protein
MASPVNLFAMTRPENKHDESVAQNFANNPVLSHSVSPEFTKAGALHCFPDAARVVHLFQTLVEELQNSSGVLRVKFAEFPVGNRRQFNVPRHDVS